MDMRIADLTDELARLSSLHQVIVWGLGQSPSWMVVDVVVQDEFTHDVVLAADGIAETILLDCT